MQIVSLAMGGQCLRGENGWEIGVYGNEMTKEGRYWWTGDVKGQGGGSKVVRGYRVPRMRSLQPLVFRSMWSRW